MEGNGYTVNCLVTNIL